MDRVKKQLGIENACHGISEDICVVVLDTGIALHPDLRKSDLTFVDFVNGRRKPYDDNGHGTHVCGIIAGDGSVARGKNSGIAPGVDLVVGKILDEKGEGDAERLLSACDWVLQNYVGKKHVILNISIAMQQNMKKKNHSLLLERINSLWEQGVLVICSAGNSGPGMGTITGLACANSIVVGCNDGYYRQGDPNLCAYYSGEGEDKIGAICPDIVAPGSYIVSCSHLTKRYCRKSGTSMATAIVSGVAAQFYNRFPTASNYDFKNELKITAIDLGLPTRKQGAGMINPNSLLHYNSTNL